MSLDDKSMNTHQNSGWVFVGGKWHYFTHGVISACRWIGCTTHRLPGPTDDRPRCRECLEKVRKS